MEPQMIASNLIRKYFSAYESKDRRALEELLSDDHFYQSAR
jgi:ketosteroid isomerase-like protein